MGLKPSDIEKADMQFVEIFTGLKPSIAVRQTHVAFYTDDIPTTSESCTT